MTGYSKTKNFVTGETIEAGDFTFEFNALTSAFDGTTGHDHSGGTSGPLIPTISSPTGFTKITTTEATDQLNFYTNVSSAAALQFSVKDGVIEPNADSDVDIGTTAKRFKDLYVDSATVTGTVTADSLAVQTSSGNAVASVTSTTGRSVFQVVSTFDGTVADQEASIEIGAKNLAHIDLKTPDDDDFDLRISHSEVSDLSMVNSLVDNLFLRSGAKVALQHGGANTKLETTSTGVTVTGTVTADGLSLGDGEYARFGNAGDLQIFHSGVHSYIQDQGTGVLSIQSDGDSIKFHDSANAKDMAKFSVGGTASLSWAGTNQAGVKLSTTEDGINVTGTVTADGVSLGDDEKIQLGATQDLELFHDGTNSYVQDAGDGQLILNTTNGGGVYVQSASETMAQFISNGAVNLYHDNAEKFATTSTGINVTGTVTADDQIIIESNDSQVAAQPTLTLRSNENASTDNQLAEIIFQGHNDQQVDQTYAYMRAESPVITDNQEEGKLKFFVRKTGNAYANSLSVDSSGIDVTGTIECDTSLQIRSSATASDDAMPDIYLDNQHSPADEQRLGMIAFRGLNNATTPELTSYGNIYTRQEVVTDGAEEGKVVLQARNGASYVNALEATKDGITVGGQITLPSSTSDSCFIGTTVTESATHLDFKLRDDDADSFRFRFDHYEDGVAAYVTAARIRPDAGIAGSDKYILDVTGKVVAEGFSGTGASANIITHFSTDGTFSSSTNSIVPTALAVKTYVDANTSGITSVVAGDGLTGGGTSGAITVTAVGGTGITANADSLDLDFTELADMTEDVEGTTEIILNDANTESRKAISEINLSAFNNDLTFANTDTTYTAGTGLSLSVGNEFSVDEAQTQITSVGTLGSLNVAGDLTLNGSYPTGTDNTFIGSASRSALDSTAISNTAIGASSLQALTTGDDNVAVGTSSLLALTTGSDNVALGKSAAQSLTTALETIAIGKGSLFTNSTASNNAAIGNSALYNLTSGTNNVGIGNSTGFRLTAGLKNTFIGYTAGYNTKDSNYIVAIGSNAGRGAEPDGETINYTGGDNTIAIGNESLYSQTSGYDNVAVGKQALKDCTTGNSCVAVGARSFAETTTGTAATGVGLSAGEFVTTASATTALGMYACRQVSTGHYNTGIGWRALSGAAGLNNRLTGSNNTAIGSNALVSLYGASGNNLAIGSNAGSALTQGTGNVLIGIQAGASLTTSNNQTIIGKFSGNGSGLDLRTDTTNRIILSTGVTPVVVATASNFDIMVGASSKAWSTANGGVRFIGSNGTSTMNWSRPSTATGNVKVAQYLHNGSQIGSILTTTTGTAYNTSSDYRLKENVSPLTGSIDRLKSLKPCTFNFLTEPSRNEEGFIAHEVQEVVSGAVSGVKDAVDEDGNIDAQGLDTSRLVPLLTSALQEAVEKIEQLEQRISALES